MAESALLEKMGRELKCPICLSLLSSAVSLTCNHVFCNLCIMKSMKSESKCPVCKVSYQRREVRPALHMDNLVNIYRSMEIDSGLNILVTQTAVPSEKIPESGKNEVQGESNSAEPRTHRSSKRKLRNKKNLEKGGSKKKENTNDKSSNPQVSMQPSSFPVKKRVHVPQNNPFETPMRLEKCQGRLVDQVKKGGNDDSIPKQQSTYGKTEIALSPFFWLRDDDDDGVTERLTNHQMEIDQVTNSPLQNVPCFSDINDSDNESPTKTNPKVKGCSGTKAVDLFDSEMFEWTQRGCSPELFSTPIKDKVSCESDGMHEEYDRGNREEPASGGAENVNSRQGDGKPDKKLLSYREANNTKSQSTQGRKISNNQSKRNSGIKRKYTRANMVEVLGEVSLDATTKCLNLGSHLIGDDVVPHRGRKMIQKNKVSSEMITVNKVEEDNHTQITQSNQTGIRNQHKKIKSAEMTDLLIDDSLSDGKPKQRTRNCKNKIGKNHRGDSESSKNQQAHNDVFRVLKEIQINKNQGNTSANKNIGSVLQKKMSYKGKTNSNRNECVGKLRANKRLKISNGGDAEYGLVDGAMNGYANNPATATETISVHKEGPQIRISDKTEPTKKVLSGSKNSFLNKCGRVPSPICCAFCQSATTSESTGEMMYYFNGRSVGPDFNGGSNIIHAHRNCTEWAPNVYFEDDIVINLESELARSRRIKCCCCGIKGAALGCYEVSCRKSFHVTCAELVPECRWDTENFVMLCPLHFSCKLPKEVSGSQKRNKKCIRPKRDSQVQQANIMVQDGASTCRLWKGLPNKWVICCSGLTVVEKEVVSNFTRMAGVSLMTTFGPSVTHVIASTDENGTCKRTFKVLMGILEGRWILKIDWVKACMEAMEPVAEEKYEITIDSHGIVGGPQCGRQRVLNQQQKLLEGLQFYFIGEFTSSCKGYLQDLVVAAGGTVLHRKPIAEDKCRSPSVSTTYIIYNDEVPNDCNSGKKSLLMNCRRKEAVALASQTGAKVAAHSWVLDSIAASKLQSL